MSFDIKELVDYRDKLVSIRDNQDVILERVIKGIAARLLRTVKLNTPVGQYDKPVSFIAYEGTDKETLVSFTPHTGKLGGTLRRGWFIDGYTNSGGYYTIKVVNNVEYAPYVENGHRIKRDGKTVGWVPGVFMLKISEQKIEKQIDKFVENELRKVLG